MKVEPAILPIGPLMIEHRLIERMVSLLEKEGLRIRNTKQVNLPFINAAIDFFRFYADRTHHGKEEDILFTELLKRKLSSADKALIESLKQDHVRARGLVEKLGSDSGMSDSLATDLGDLVKLYREHIQREDKQFFIPAMKYLNKEEQDAMLCKFWEFDRALIHEKYKKTIEQLENE
jgi:hemerythrin-like domain-containing protein